MLWRGKSPGGVFVLCLRLTIPFGESELSMEQLMSGVCDKSYTSSFKAFIQSSVDTPPKELQIHINALEQKSV